MAEELRVERRQSLGKRNNRRIRRSGGIPGILYGHGMENVSLTVPAEPLDMLVHHGNRLVTLTGAVNESAFIRDVQWNVWGTHVLHVDFTRVSADELVEVEVAVELRGEAPGVKEGGVVEHMLHQVAIRCPVASIPEKIAVNINHLGLHGAVTVADLPLPDRAVALDDATSVVVHCIEPVEAPEEEGAEAAPGEPEVIGEKKDQEEDEG